MTAEGTMLMRMHNCWAFITGKGRPRRPENRASTRSCSGGTVQHQSREPWTRL